MQPVDWNNWTPVDNAVICFIKTGGHVLLIRKKRGLGSGKINGPGGRLESGETPQQAAIRETHEEVGLTMLDPEPRAELSFAFADGYALFATVFIASRYRGTLVETPEAEPFWCRLERIPYDRMWSDDYLWLPHVLGGHYVTGRFVFDGDTMLEEEVEVLPQSDGSSAEHVGGTE
jgi:8-oxo-dGTP diphosphatase